MNEDWRIRLLLLRHGKTSYSGLFPDLTPDGLAHVEQVAQDSISDWVTRNEITHDKMIIVTSPSPRAHGTAWTVCKVLGYPKRLQFADAVAPMKWRDEGRAQAALLQFRGRSYVDYETEAVFQDPEVFETPDEVRARFYRGLRDSLLHSWHKDSRAAGHQQNVIIVSHYEVLSPIVRDLFGIPTYEHTALRHAEPIELSILPDSAYPREALVEGRFREGNFPMKRFNLHTSRFEGCP